MFSEESQREIGREGERESMERKRDRDEVYTGVEVVALLGQLCTAMDRLGDGGSWPATREL